MRRRPRPQVRATLAVIGVGTIPRVSPRQFQAAIPRVIQKLARAARRPLSWLTTTARTPAQTGTAPSKPTAKPYAITAPKQPQARA